MKNYIKKVHLIDSKTSPESYKQSPHIVKAITEKSWTICNQGFVGAPERVTNTIKKVTCKECLRKYNFFCVLPLNFYKPT